MDRFKAMDLSHIWLPYTQHGLNPQPLHVAEAEGCRLKLSDGRELIDGISNWWTACHGHKHPYMVKAVQQQAEKLPHVMLGGLIHEGAVKLAERLSKLTGLPRVFFSDSGSTAVEVSLKMAAQYWKNQNKNTKKQRFLHFRNSYHGDTMGAMSVSDNEGMHSPFVGYMPMQFCVDIPSDELAFEEFDTLLASQKSQIAAVIIEPLVQCAGGMKFHGPDVLAEIYRITKKHDILFIVDEIATGFARTGYMFAFQEAGITPDIICLGKALTGGMLTMAATIASDEVFSKFTDDKPEHALMHGPTYMANPIACAAANASLDLFENEPRLAQVARIEELLQGELAKCESLPVVKDVRVKGALGVVQLDSSDYKARLRSKFPEMGVWLRPIEDVIYIAPPLVVSENDLLTLTAAVYKVLAELK